MKTDIAVKKLITSFKEGRLIQTYTDLETISGCTGRTLQRKINKCRLLASYNKNSKFYTLPTLAGFNDFGIWQYHGVLFSRQVNLYQTLVYLVDQSTGGYTSGELVQIVQVKTDDALRVLTSPCFDFRESKRPMIAIDLWKEFGRNNDGAVFQYSTDNGNTWANIGDTGQGINW